ncbi:MAG TPA: YhdP family protein [Usitatibacteraceae bacterium]|nr:YhdP family protein [Usitatibacteraceae bacterium]
MKGACGSGTRQTGKIARAPQVSGGATCGPATGLARRNQNIKKIAFRIGKISTRTVFWLAVAAAFLLALAVATVKYAVMPNIERYQGDIVSRVAEASGMDVSARSIRGRWSGFRPYVDLEEVVFRETLDPALPQRTAGAEALRLPHLSASLSWWALLAGHVRLGAISVQAPELALTREADGSIIFAGRVLNPRDQPDDDGQFVGWLLNQEGIEVHDATLLWDDRTPPGRMLRLSRVDIAVRRTRSGHEFALNALPPAGLARQVQLRGEAQLVREQGRWKAAGTLFAQLDDAWLDPIRQHVPIPDALIAGNGNVRAWITFDSAAPQRAVPNDAMRAFTPVRTITADVALVNARARLDADLEPLDLKTLAGRIEYQAQDAGFTVGSRGLQFRTASGVSSAPADFSVMLSYHEDPAQAGGEITANGIDLKVMTALLEYFPVGKDLRSVAARFAPHGTVQRTLYRWSGPLDNPRAYRIKGTLADFSINQTDAFPGVRGFTGTIDGEDKGGEFSVASKDFTFEVPALFRAPLKFSRFEGRGTWKVDADTIQVGIGSLALENEDLAGEFSGKYWRYRASGARAAEEKGPGSLDLTGRFGRIKATAVPNYLPNGIAAARDYVEWAFRDGLVTGADVVLKGPLYEFPFHKGVHGQFRIASTIKDIDLRHSEGWPQVNDISGELVFENTGFTAQVSTAKIFNTLLGPTTVAVEDFAAHPPLLTIKGGAPARAEDAARYLRESPLLESVGGFTRFVALEGPGRLELDLKIALGNFAEHKVAPRFAGRYALNRGKARVTVGDKAAEITNIVGSIAFSEKETRSGAITGVAFGNPLTVGIASNAEGGVTTDFAGRADAAALSSLLPFALPRQVSGATDFSGKVIGRAKGTDIQVGSNLLGLASSLPAPLAKRADEPRRLQFEVTDAGQAGERMRLAVAGNAAPAGDLAESRIEAAFKRRVSGTDASGAFFGGIASVGDPVGDKAIPEGMWLTGRIARFDFDAWKHAYDNFHAPREGGAAASNESPIAGFDFNLGSLVAYGRPFKAMKLKGRHGGEDWRMSVDGEEAAGDFSWRPGAYAERGNVRARLTRFSLAEELPSGVPAVPGGAEKTVLPALDIVADNFTFRERFLGKLELRATPTGDNWKIDQLSISNGHARLDADGIYHRYGDPQRSDGVPRTSMQVKLDSSNLNALFDQFGYADYMKGGKGGMEGKLSWPGHSFQFQFATLSGSMKLAASDGRIAKIEPGAGKLLGLLSLQSLPNRLTLDFRDIYDDGLAYRAIEADVAINNGVMTTENFEIKGLSARIQISGTASLPAETVNIKARVEPQLGEGAAIGAGVILTPAVGAAVYVASKLLQKFLQYEMAISGSWDNPQVVDVKKKENPNLAPAAAAPAAAEGKSKAP